MVLGREHARNVKEGKERGVLNVLCVQVFFLCLRLSSCKTEPRTVEFGPQVHKEGTRKAYCGV